MLCTVSLLVRQNFWWPKLPPLPAWLAVAAVVGLICQYFRLNADAMQNPILEHLSFFVISIWFYQYFRGEGLQSKVAYIVGITICIVSLYGFLQIYGVEPFPLTTQFKSGFFSTFGNPNMTAQYLALGFPLLIWWLKENRNCRILLWVTLTLALTYINFLMCRSVFISIFVIFSFSLFYLKSVSIKQLFILMLSVFLLTFVVRQTSSVVRQTSIVVTPLESPKISGQLDSSSRTRLFLWQDTLRMISDKPLVGHGPVSFEFSYLPYQATGNLIPRESRLFKSPHNEILRFSSEYGVPLSLVVFGVIFSLALLVKGNAYNKSDLIVPINTLLVLLVETIFQFPFDLAYPKVSLAMAAGLSLSFLPDRQLGDKFFTKTILLSMVTAFLTTTGYKFVISNYYFRNYQFSIDKMESACELNPTNWKSCIAAINLNMLSGNSERAEQQVNKLLEMNHYNYMALKYLGLIKFQQGDPLAGCASFYVIDSLFRFDSSVSRDFQSHCAAWKIENRPEHAILGKFDFQAFPFTVIEPKTLSKD
jgi:O-antigen ligase